MTVVAVLGLGEAGGAIAADLRTAGADVRGYDRVARAHRGGVGGPGRGRRRRRAEPDHGRLGDRRGALGRSPRSARTRSTPTLNTGSVGLKRELADLVGAGFADVALMAPVPGRGLRTPALASGTGAAGFAAAFAPLGMPVEVVGEEPGEAARRKLLRSVAWKGFAAVVARGARRRARRRRRGVRPRAARGGPPPAADIERMEHGSRAHAARRVRRDGRRRGELRATRRRAAYDGGRARWLEELRMADHPVPSERARELVRGAVDYHVHIAPDFAERRITDVQLAGAAWSSGSAASA